MKKSIALFFALLCIGTLVGQDLQSFELTEEWQTKIEKIAPKKARVNTERKKKLLVFSLHTGYEHWVIPHTEAVVRIIGEKSKAFEITVSYDIASFDKKNLKKYDAIVLNNNCSIGDKRNLFWDVLKEDASLTNAQRVRRSKKLENNLLKYVKKGHGIMVLHGGITMQNKSLEFGKMVGGSFDFHPKQQKVKISLVDLEHPLVKAFNGKAFEHIDEPYFFNNAYFDYNFRPLLSMETKKLEGLKTVPKDTIKYISWIKKYGKGKVFFSSPSHNAQSYEDPHLLQFLLDGMQYIAGDLICDDSPIGK